MVTVSAPGKLVLCGEHAVLHGQPAIVMAINRRMRVKMRLRNDNIIAIKSHKFGIVNLKFADLETEKCADKWYGSVAFLVRKLLSAGCGIDIDITSQIEDVGFGSSGALFSCVAYGLLKITINSITMNSKIKLLFYILDLYREFNKLRNKSAIQPSGIDIVASVLGGVAYFYPKKKVVEKLDFGLLKNTKLTAIFTGQRTNKKLVRDVIFYAKHRKRIYKKIGKIVKKVRKAIIKKKRRKMFSLLRKNQKMLHKLGMSNITISRIISQCKKKKIIAKISGSGLGDCVLALGKIDINDKRCFDIEVDEKGIEIE